MYKLMRFILSYNQLNEFPDLTNASSTLEELDLAHNNLETVGFLSHVRFLRILILSENKLTEFPDLANVGTTLQRLELFSNYIRYIPEGLMMSLKMLNYLDLRENPLLSLPGLCHLNNTIELLLSESSLNCGWKMAFYKVMESAGNILFPQASPHCDLPANLANKDWKSITTMDLIDGGGKFDTRYTCITKQYIKLHTNMPSVKEW
jgi:Leucine-rich repeat (LRR) protein